MSTSTIFNDTMKTRDYISNERFRPSFYIEDNKLVVSNPSSDEDHWLHLEINKEQVKELKESLLIAKYLMKSNADERVTLKVKNTDSFSLDFYYFNKSHRFAVLFCGDFHAGEELYDEEYIDWWLGNLDITLTRMK